MDMTLIVGCGYLGRRVAVRLRQAGEPVVGAVRGGEGSARALRRLRIGMIRLDLDRDSRWQPPSGRYRVLYLAPPPGGGRTDPRIERLLSRLEANPPQRLVYASSSAVYGDRHGAWVDEHSQVQSRSETAARRLHAEQQVRQWCERQGVRHVILRIAGIYGPGRLPLARLRAGQPVVCEGEAGISNRIHVEDLAGACIAALQHPAPETLYNIADGRPGSTTAFVRAVAGHLDLPLPPEIGLAEALRAAPPARARFLRESRRLDVSRMRRDLLPELKYPNVDSALAHGSSAEKDIDD